MNMASNERAIINQYNDRAKFFGGEDAPQLTIYDVRYVLDHYRRTCLKCGKQPATSCDHVKPLKNGGSNTIDNLQLLCDECNKAKGVNEDDYRAGDIITGLPDDYKPKRGNNGNHGAKGRSGRKPKAATLLKRRIETEKTDDAEYAFALYASVMRDELEELATRLSAADWIARRVLGNPRNNDQMQAEIVVKVLREQRSNHIPTDIAPQPTAYLQ